jgi:hypothetical protein
LPTCMKMMIEVIVSKKFIKNFLEAACLSARMNRTRKIGWRVEMEKRLLPKPSPLGCAGQLDDMVIATQLPPRCADPLVGAAEEDRCELSVPTVEEFNPCGNPALLNESIFTGSSFRLAHSSTWRIRLRMISSLSGCGKSPDFGKTAMKRLKIGIRITYKINALPTHDRRQTTGKTISNINHEL